MIRSAGVYVLVFAVFAAVLAAIRAPITPAIVFLPLIVWPDLSLLTGLGKMDHRSAWVCRLAGMAALLWTYAHKFIKM